MKVIIRRTFLANDGMEFSSAKDCEKYEKVQFSKSDLDFMKEFMSTFLSHSEAMMNYLKQEADHHKGMPLDMDKQHSDMCYKDLSKMRTKLKKLSEIQRKIKRMR